MLLSRPLIDGELWWSALARHAERIGLGQLVPRHLMLIGNHCSLGSPLFPRQLTELNRRMQLAKTTDSIIRRHTALSYYRPFLAPAKIAAATASMTGNGNVEFELGLAAMKDHPKVLKYCPACVQADLRDFGEAAWRVVHQLPGSVLCAAHHCSLHNTSVSARFTGQYVKLVTINMAGPGTPLNPPDSAFNDLRWLAAANRNLLLGNPAQPGPAKLAELYRRTLTARGLRDDFGRLKFAELVGAFQDRFRTLLPVVSCQLRDPDKRDNWLARMVRYPRNEQSPLKHLLVIRFLGLDLLPTLQTAAALPEPERNSPKPRPPARRSKHVTLEKVTQHREQWLALRRNWTGGSLREHADTLYCWLWRNDNAWLKAHAR